MSQQIQRLTPDPEVFLNLTDTREKFIFLLRFAVLAPSLYNSQPWIFKASGSTLEVWADKKQALHVTDPKERELFISVGCAIENFLLSADYYGWPFDLEHFPDPGSRYLAARFNFKERHYLTKDVGHFPHLFYSIPRRHTSYYPYDTRDIPADFVLSTNSLSDATLKVIVINDEGRRERFVDIAKKATKQAFADDSFKRELRTWLVSNFKRHKEGVPGYTIGVSSLVSMIKPLLISRVRQNILKSIEATPAFVVISTEGDDPVDWVRAGEVYERIALMAQAVELKTAALTLPIDWGTYYEDIKEACDTKFRPQVLMRIGYCEKIPRPSPRRGVEEILM